MKNKKIKQIKIEACWDCPYCKRASINDCSLHSSVYHLKIYFCIGNHNSLDGPKDVTKYRNTGQFPKDCPLESVIVEDQ